MTAIKYSRRICLAKACVWTSMLMLLSIPGALLGQSPTERDSAVALYLMRNLDNVLIEWRPPSNDAREIGTWLRNTKLRWSAFVL